MEGVSAGRGIQNHPGFVLLFSSKSSGLIVSLAGKRASQQRLQFKKFLAAFFHQIGGMKAFAH
jgi:hypothetical protein